MSWKILLVEDENHIAKLILHHLNKEGYQITHVTHGDEALEKFDRYDFALVILDLMLPGIDGLEVCRKIRENSSKHVPIIMLTAKSDEVDKIVGLEMGADDYVTKPFSPRELTARVKAQLRGRVFEKRSKNGQEIAHSDKKTTVYKIGELVIKTEQYKAFVDDKELNLTPKEFELLKFLAKHPNHVFTRDHLLEQIWGFDFFGDTRTVDVHIRHIRQKINETGGSAGLIETVRGVGYCLSETENDL